jgi:phosphoglycolate phosphatase
MPAYEAIIFDFDGTFADTSEGIYLSANAALRALGLREISLRELRGFLGPPLQEGFVTLLGMGEAQARQAVEVYRREYAAGNYLKLRIYDGLLALLEDLQKRGIKLGVGSAKLTDYLEEILRAIGCRGYFDAVCGASPDQLEGGKSGIIAEALRQCGARPERCLMVGDRRYDIEGAKALGMPSAGVLFGFGSREELEAAGADFLLEDSAALRVLLNL